MGQEKDVQCVEGERQNDPEKNLKVIMVLSKR